MTAAEQTESSAGPTRVPAAHLSSLVAQARAAASTIERGAGWGQFTRDALWLGKLASALADAVEQLTEALGRPMYEPPTPDAAFMAGQGPDRRIRIGWEVPVGEGTVTTWRYIELSHDQAARIVTLMLGTTACRDALLAAHAAAIAAERAESLEKLAEQLSRAAAEQRREHERLSRGQR